MKNGIKQSSLLVTRAVANLEACLQVNLRSE